MSDTDRIYIEDLAIKLGRAAHTIRQWIKRSDFPEDLLPGTEGGRNKLFWTPSQMDGLKQYASVRATARGSFGRASSAA